MGTKMGPSDANLYIENQFFNQYDGTKHELSYGRYIDDFIGATSSSKEELLTESFISS